MKKNYPLPLPLTMKLVESLLDANMNGNLRVAMGNKDKLAFVCKAGDFDPLTMPFVATAAPGHFESFFQKILLGRIENNTEAYLDDIAVYIEKVLDHKQAVAEIFGILSRYNMCLKEEKCEFLRLEVK